MKPDFQKMITLSFVYALIVQAVGFILLFSMIKLFLEEYHRPRAFPGIDIKEFK